MYEFPLQSLDFNLKENIWLIIKIKVSGRHHQVCTVEQLKVAIQEE